MGEDKVWAIIFLCIQAAMAIAGFVGAMLINRLIKSIDGLAAVDRDLYQKLNDHREDVLRNYVRNEQLEPIKKDIIGRVDRMEMSFKEALMAHEHRELQIYNMQRHGGS